MKECAAGGPFLIMGLAFVMMGFAAIISLARIADTLSAIEKRLRSLEK